MARKSLESDHSLNDTHSENEQAFASVHLITSDDSDLDFRIPTYTWR